MDDESNDEHAAGGVPGAEASGGAAVEQFQRAALDAVRAARALLDAAESVIQEPAAIEAMVKTVMSVARSASEAVVGFASAGGAPDAPQDDDDDGSGVEHIPVG